MNLYLLFKSLHLIAVISWLAGLLYLPRIFVYHAEAAHESQKDIFKISGVLLIHSLGFAVFSELWMKIKIILVTVLTFYHFLLGKYLADFSSDSNQKTSKFYRIINEVPTIILIVVVFVVVFKPL